MRAVERLDQFARRQKRAWVAAARRGVKIVRERGRTRWVRTRDRFARRLRRARHEAARDVRQRMQRNRHRFKVVRERAVNLATATGNLTRKAGRYLWGLRRPFVRAQRRAGRLGEQYRWLREEWAVERELEAALDGSEPVLFGPWTSEVGYEVLYWLAFVRWVKMSYRLRTDRLVVMSRGGVSSWYADITPRYLEIFNRVTPEEFARRQAERVTGAGSTKQVGITDFDRALIEGARRELGAPRIRVVHPSLMYRLFRYFWAGHRPLGFVESHAVFQRIDGSRQDVRLPGLPADYVAVKFYAAQSLPATPDNQRLVRRIVDAVAKRHPVVVLDTGIAFDEHGYYTGLASGSRVVSIREFVRPADNLGIQAAVIAGARGFVGTCGSVAWLAPMLGVDTLAVMTDSRYLHAHLQVARWVYRTLDAGRFSPLDLGAFAPFGLTVASALGQFSKRPSALYR